MLLLVSVTSMTPNVRFSVSPAGRTDSLLTSRPFSATWIPTPASGAPVVDARTNARSGNWMVLSGVRRRAGAPAA